MKAISKRHPLLGGGPKNGGEPLLKSLLTKPLIDVKGGWPTQRRGPKPRGSSSRLKKKKKKGEGSATLGAKVATVERRGEYRKGDQTARKKRRQTEKEEKHARAQARSGGLKRTIRLALEKGSPSGGKRKKGKRVETKKTSVGETARRGRACLKRNGRYLEIKKGRITDAKKRARKKKGEGTLVGLPLGKCHVEVQKK